MTVETVKFFLSMAIDRVYRMGEIPLLVAKAIRARSSGKFGDYGWRPSKMVSNIHNWS
jgi:hypothetical protein